MITDYRRLTEEDYKRAEMHGVSRTNLYNRYEMLAWDLERAITQPVIKRKYSEELIEKAARNGIKYNTLAQRIQRGMDEELAATIPPNADRWTEAEKQFLIEHNDILTAKELADRLGRPVGSICSQRHKLGLRKRG